MRVSVGAAAPEHQRWEKEARKILDAHKVESWKEWAPQWLLPGLYEGGGASKGARCSAEVARGLEVPEEERERDAQVREAGGSAQVARVEEHEEEEDEVAEIVQSPQRRPAQEKQESGWRPTGGKKVRSLFFYFWSFANLSIS